MTCMLDLDPVLLLTKIKGNREFSNEAEHATGDITHHYRKKYDFSDSIK